MAGIRRTSRGQLGSQ